MRVWCVLSLVLAVACNAPSVKPGPGEKAPAAADVASLPSVTLPDLTAVDGPVQTQIRTRYDALVEPSAGAGSSATDRARRFAELGHVLLAATFFDEQPLCAYHTCRILSELE